MPIQKNSTLNQEVKLLFAMSYMVLNTHYHESKRRKLVYNVTAVKCLLLTVHVLYCWLPALTPVYR